MLLHQDQGMWFENKAKREKAGNPEGENGEMEGMAPIIVTAALPREDKDMATGPWYCPGTPSH